MRWLIGLVAFLAACASTPPDPLAMRVVHELAGAASRATLAGNWHVAAARWAEVAQQYAALDDWPNAGRAQLGRSQALAADGSQLLAREELSGLAVARRYPDTVRGEANYQLALLDLGAGQLDEAKTHLDVASELIPASASLQAAIANAQARRAAGRADWEAVSAGAMRALAVTSVEPGERANAWRLLALSALRRGKVLEASELLGNALALDKTHARTEAISADLRLLAEAAHARHDKEAGTWDERAAAACAALGAARCAAVNAM